MMTADELDIAYLSGKSINAINARMKFEFKRNSKLTNIIKDKSEKSIDKLIKFSKKYYSGDIISIEHCNHSRNYNIIISIINKNNIILFKYILMLIHNFSQGSLQERQIASNRYNLIAQKITHLLEFVEVFIGHLRMNNNLDILNTIYHINIMPRGVDHEPINYLQYTMRHKGSPIVILYLLQLNLFNLNYTDNNILYDISQFILRKGFVRDDVYNIYHKIIKFIAENIDYNFMRSIKGTYVRNEWKSQNPFMDLYCNISDNRFLDFISYFTDNYLNINTDLYIYEYSLFMWLNSDDDHLPGDIHYFINDYLNPYKKYLGNNDIRSVIEYSDQVLSQDEKDILLDFIHNVHEIPIKGCISKN